MGPSEHTTVKDYVSSDVRVTHKDTEDRQEKRRFGEKSDIKIKHEGRDINGDSVNAKGFYNGKGAYMAIKKLMDLESLEGDNPPVVAVLLI